MRNEEFIEKARKVHGDKYDYSKVVYIKNSIPVTIICRSCGNEFKQRPANHIHMHQGCPFCNRSFKKTTEEFIRDVKTVHGDKYDYSKVEYKGNKENVCIICHEKDENGKEHGEFWQQALTHLRGYGCPKCSGNHRMNKEEFIEKAEMVHGDKYDYSKVEYKGSHEKVCIICHKKDAMGNEHGEFWQTAKNHLNGENCPKCKGKKVANDDFLFRAKEMHGNKYDYSKTTYTNNKTRVCIICPKHGEFWQTPHEHLDGCGCPKCSVNVSKNEIRISDFIKRIEGKDLVKERDKTILKPLELDLYIPSKNIAIEYDGLIWHSEKFGKDRNYHLNKTEECKKKGVKLIHIFEDEFLEHEDIVFSKLSHILGKDIYKDKVYARKCEVTEIDSDKARKFLEYNHIQSFTPSTVYLGCFFQYKLYGVMTFKRKRKDSEEWELTRFATDINYNCTGFGGKLFTHFIRKYKPKSVKSFADRRWTLDETDNIYTKLGFELTQILRPDYRYVVGNRRIHKFNMRKERLLKQFGDNDITQDMTEKEMCDKLGFYRIWDCGLLKYEWFNKN